MVRVQVPWVTVPLGTGDTVAHSGGTWQGERVEGVGLQFLTTIEQMEQHLLS